MQVQLLNLFDEQPGWNNFVDLGNESNVAIIRSHAYPFIHLSGSNHSGKSHLLKAWCNDRAITSFYHDIAIGSDFNIADNYSYIALDNIEYANENMQQQIFNLFNAIKLHGQSKHLLTSSQIPLADVVNLREDLKTRLLSGLNLHLKMPDDNVLTEIIKRYIKSQGINLADNVINYIFNHYTRNIGDIFDLIKQAVASALINKSSITIPLIKHLINDDAL